ncbi:MAG: hypothetical protein CL941_03280 [Desulfobacter sp.]|nr:hypothetical protein [Desulfobacter sp.]
MSDFVGRNSGCFGHTASGLARLAAQCGICRSALWEIDQLLLPYRYALFRYSPPPHAKLLLAASTKLGGCDGTFSFKKIGDDYKNIPVYAIRIVHALAGTMLNLLFFIPLNQFGASRPLTFGWQYTDWYDRLIFGTFSGWR